MHVLMHMLRTRDPLAHFRSHPILNLQTPHMASWFSAAAYLRHLLLRVAGRTFLIHA